MLPHFHNLSRAFILLFNDFSQYEEISDSAVRNHKRLMCVCTPVRVWVIGVRVSDRGRKT